MLHGLKLTSEGHLIGTERVPGTRVVPAKNCKQLLH